MAAVGRDPDGEMVVLEINQSTPRSAHDRFALDLARARADVIVTTGAILRAEPRLAYELASDRAEAAVRELRRLGVDKARIEVLPATEPDPALTAAEQRQVVITPVEAR